jgi:hypothetical protein
MQFDLTESMYENWLKDYSHGDITNRHHIIVNIYCNLKRIYKIELDYDVSFLKELFYVLINITEESLMLNTTKYEKMKEFAALHSLDNKVLKMF